MNNIPRLGNYQYPDESYDDWQERVNGERPKYDGQGNELVPDWMINNMGFGIVKKKTAIVIPRDRAGYVYILEVPNTPGLYKIGRTSDPDNRLRTFNVKLPFPVQYLHVIKTDDQYTLEAQLHQLFKAQRVNGEFFLLNPADIAILKALGD